MNASLVPLATAFLIAAAGATWGVVAGSPRSMDDRRWRAAAGGAAVLTLAAVGAVLAAWAAGAWWFVGEKVIGYVPLAVAALAWFAIATARAPRAQSSDSSTESAAAVTPPEPAPAAPAPVGVRVAACPGVSAAAAGLVLQLVVGFPAPWWGIAAVLVLTCGSTLLVGMLMHRAARRRVGAAVSAFTAVALAVAATVLVGSAAPAELDGHAHAHAPDPGRASASASGAAAPVSVTSLRAPADAPADVRVELEAQQQSLRLPSGDRVDAWTFGALGGPLIEATEGDLVEVALRNRDIAEGVTAHWHGYDVPAGEDGVAGVTQDAVLPGDEFTYRFVASEPGTFWYHTHQRSSTGVARGLYGPLVVHARGEERADHDVVLALHTFAGHVVLGGSDIAQTTDAAAGDRVRVRLINTDRESQLFAVSGTGFRVVAIDGRDVAEPGVVDGHALRIPAGGRYDIEFDMPDGPVAVRAAASDSASVTFAPGARGDAPAARFDDVLNPLAYGEGSPHAPTAESYDVERTIVLDRLPRLLPTGPAYAYTVDGAAYPHIPPTTVREGDRVKLTVVNRGFETHPMHPHGHHVTVLSVDGRAPVGSPLVLDTFEVEPGETWEVELVADNPGIWMDHCHNLDHAALGMVTHLVYEGVVTPFDHGGAAGNEPE